MKEFGEGLVAQGLGRDLHARKPRQRRSRARIAGDSESGGKPLGGEALQAVLGQRRLTAEEMSDPGNVERQPVGAIDRGERGVAGAPVAKTREEPRVFGRLSLDRDEGGMARARVGEGRGRRSGRAARPPRRRTTSRSALASLAKAASGALLSTPLRRRARSVARRGSQSERNLRVVKSQVLVKNQFLASPFEPHRL